MIVGKFKSPSTTNLILVIFRHGTPTKSLSSKSQISRHMLYSHTSDGAFRHVLLGRSVDVDEDEQQEIEKDADDPQHGQESLLRCAHVWTR